jgi:hypothetical protein
MYDVAVTFDLYKVGITEDGEDAISNRYFVMLQAPDGSRWNHKVRFDGCKAGYDDEHGIPYFEDLCEVASANAEKLAATIRDHLNAGGEIDFFDWIEDHPAYGSEAYQKLDSFGYFRDLERMHDH